jgi:hypothetical protein
MKNFKKYITEVNSKTTEGDVSADGHDFANDLSNPDTITRINSFLGVMGDMEHLIPENALNKIREKLGRLSISFGDIDLSEDGGVVSVPLTQFGGRFGKDENGDINDDGISHKVEGGLSLEVQHEVTTAGTHFLRARIV